MDRSTKVGLKTAIIEPVGGHGGMDYYDFGLARGLVKSGCRVTLYTCDETELAEGLPFSCVLSFKGIYGDAPKSLRAVRYATGLVAALMDAKRCGHQIIHLHFFHAGALEALTVRLVKLAGFRLVITVHDVESFAGGDSREAARRIFGAADRLIAHNRVSVQELTGKLGLPESRIARIPHGNYLDYSQDAPSREQARRTLGIPNDAEVLLFFGQIKQVKGLDLLLEALAMLCERRPNVLLLIAGKVWKDDFSRYQAQIDALGLAAHTRTDIRYIPDTEAANYYAAADIVVLPYRKIYQSGVLLMAMSFGRTVVASDLAGMAEVVSSGESGFLFRCGDANALAEQLDTVLSSEELRERVATAGLQAMAKEYDWGRIGEATCGIYREVLTGAAVQAKS